MLDIVVFYLFLIELVFILNGYKKLIGGTIMLNQSKELFKLKIKMKKKLIKVGYNIHYVNDLCFSWLEELYKMEIK